MAYAIVAALVALVGAVFLRHRPVALGVFAGLTLVAWALGSAGAGLVTAVIVLAILLAQPLFVVLGAVSVACLGFLSTTPVTDYGIFAEKIFELTDKNVLLAIPFFVLSGEIMTHGGIARRLIDFARELTAWMPGGLLVAGVGACVLFGAISGSSPVTLVAIGSLMMPALIQAGYPQRTALGMLTSSGSLGIVVPPSIPMLIYAIVVSGVQPVDVGELFLAGLGPGLFIGGLLAVWCVVAVVRNSPAERARLPELARGLAILATPIVVGVLLGVAVGPWGYLAAPVGLAALGAWVARRAFARGFWALLMPFIILGGIYSGAFTPTEAAAVAVVYALVVELYVYRELSWNELPKLVANSAVMMGALILIMVIAFVFNDYLVSEKIPDAAVEWLARADLSRPGFLLALNGLLLVVGMFMDIMSAILIVAPLVAPMALHLGIDPIHLGIIFIVNLEVGYLTPPIGLNLFVASSMFKKPVGEIVRAVAPFIAIMVVGVLGITYLPSIAMAPGEWLATLKAPATIDVQASGGTSVEPAGAPDAASDATPKAKVLSIEELMKQAGEAGGADANEAPAGDAKTP